MHSKYGAADSSLTGSAKKSKHGIYNGSGDAGDGGEAMTEAETAMREKRANRFKSEEVAHQSKWAAVAALGTLGAGGRLQNGKKKKKGAGGGGGGYSFYDASAGGFGTGSGGGDGGGAHFDLDSLKVVGTCQRIEKDYFRLTSAPDPSTVRPEPVLKGAMAALKAKWRDESVRKEGVASTL